MHDLVRGYAGATFESAVRAGDLDRVVTDLEVFIRAMEASDPLRNTLSDPSLATSVRRGVVRDLLVDRAVAEMADLTGFAARIERARVTFRSPSRSSSKARAATDAAPAGWHLVEQEGGGRLAVRDRVHGFAERVLQELPSLAEIDTVEDELFRVARIIEANAQLREALGDPEYLNATRRRLLEDLFGAKIAPASIRLVELVVSVGRLRDLVGMLDYVIEIAAAERGRRVAEVRSAVDLDGAEQDRLAAALGRIVDRTVEVRVVVDPAVIGGAFVSVGDLVIDGTVRQRFERLRDVLEQKS